MRRHDRLFSARLLLFCLAALIAPLTGCSPNAAYLQSKKEGKFPTSDDFPLTKWVCREKICTSACWTAAKEKCTESILTG